MHDIQRYDDAVRIIKAAILQSQYEAARSINENQFILYIMVSANISH